MCKFNFGAFFKVMKGAFARCFSDPTLCQLLFDSILVPCGWPQVISKETASKLKNNKINIPEMYRDGLTFISDDTMQAYFREQIVPKLEKLKISHMIGELIQIVQNDTSIDSDTKTRILQNASYESLDAFLALLFHLSLVTENKTIVSKASRQNISVHHPKKPVSTHLMPQRLTIQNQQEILLDSENFDFTLIPQNSKRFSDSEKGTNPTITVTK